MTRKQKLTDGQVALKKRVVAAYTKPFGFRYHHPNWNKNIWSKSTTEIIEFLEHRFETTIDEVEYYACMVYLHNVVPDSELLIEFGDAQQVVDMRGTYVGMGSKKVINRIQQKATKRVVDISTGIESVSVVGFSGGM